MEVKSSTPTISTILMMSEGNNMPVEVKEKKDLKDICENDVTLSGSTREVRS